MSVVGSGRVLSGGRFPSGMPERVGEICRYAALQSAIVLKRELRGLQEIGVAPGEETIGASVRQALAVGEPGAGGAAQGAWYQTQMRVFEALSTWPQLAVAERAALATRIAHFPAERVRSFYQEAEWRLLLEPLLGSERFPAERAREMAEEPRTPRLYLRALARSPRLRQLPEVRERLFREMDQEILPGLCAEAEGEEFRSLWLRFCTWDRLEAARLLGRRVGTLPLSPEDVRPLLEADELEVRLQVIAALPRLQESRKEGVTRAR